MNTTIRFLLLFFINGFFLPSLSFSTIISGKITNQRNEPLPFVNVFIKGTTTGTTSNMDGNYSIDLTPGSYELVFKYIGYKMYTKNITVAGKKTILNVTMQPENIQLKEITIAANAEDPAYAVIRQAIKKRKYYRDQVEAFSCDVYIKGLQRITKFPQKIMGVVIDPTGEIDSTTGIVYLSESVSKFNFKKSDHIKEEMISSKVSGNNRAFSYNQASDMLFNFYENTIGIDQLSDRGFISPISNSALFYYRYKLIGTFVENSAMINKIEVIPIRKNDPVFRGYIYIMDDSWRIHSTELMLTKDAQIDFVDTLLINQVYLPVEKEVWMPFSNKFTFNFSVLGIHGNGVFAGVNSNYILNPDFPRKFFNGEVMKIVEDANKKDSSYWNETRPVPLTQEEENDYRKRDSLQGIKESKPYLDSVDRKSNKVTFGKLVLTGYTYTQRYKKETLTFSPLISNIGFNTVEGYNVGLQMEFLKRFDKNKRYNATFLIRHGFSSNQTYGEGHVNYVYKPEKLASWSLSAGRNAVQFNTNSSLSPFINSLYTLFANYNYMKLYQKSFFTASQQIEIRNGVLLNTSVEYSDRVPLLNTSDYIVSDDERRIYTSNDPQDPLHYGYSFEKNQALTVLASLKLQYKQQFYTLPYRKIILGSKYPSLTILYKQAISGIIDSDVNYSFFKTSLAGDLRMKLFGKGNYNISAGIFLQKYKMEFIDYYHFNGNQTIFSGFLLTAFNLLDYYKYSTNDKFVEAHYEHDFGGFILNKVPLLRKLKLNEIAGIHYLSTKPSGQYIELSLGLTKLGLIRASFVMAFMQNARIKNGIQIGITF